MIVVIYMIGKKKDLFGSTFRLSAQFENVSGLLIGNNVRLAGITIGTVENITIISDSSVQVDLSIQETVRKFIKKDAMASIGSEGLMGNKIINILSGGISKELIEPNSRIATLKPLDLDEIMVSVKKTIENTEVITGNLSVVTTNIKEGKGIMGMLLLDTVFSKSVGQTLVNLQSGTKGFSNNMEAAQNSFLLKPLLGKKTKEEKEEIKLIKEKESLENKEQREENRQDKKDDREERKQDRKDEREEKKQAKEALKTTN